MLKSLFLRWSKSKSDEQIRSFLDPFLARSTEANGPTLKMAFLIYAQFVGKDPTFQKALDSPRGNPNIELSVKIIELNGLIKQLITDGRVDEASALRFWNTTFRCMQYADFHSHGSRLWNHTGKLRFETRSWLIEKRRLASQTTVPSTSTAIDKAIELVECVPLQFKHAG